MYAGYILYINILSGNSLHENGIDPMFRRNPSKSISVNSIKQWTKYLRYINVMNKYLELIH